MSGDPTKRLLVIGGIGSVLTALCCFTPVLAIVLTTIGLGADNLISRSLLPWLSNNQVLILNTPAVVSPCHAFPPGFIQ